MNAESPDGDVAARGDVGDLARAGGVDPAPALARRSERLVGGDPVAGGTGDAPGRCRVRRTVARPRAVKVLYGEDELATVAHAAAQAGLRPTSYVAAAALASATGTAAPAADAYTRGLLTELMLTRAALRQYGVNLNQVAAALNSGVSEVPVWLSAAVAGADRATARIDEAAGLLRRRLA